MKRIFSILLLLLCSVSISKADQIQQLKDAITSQLLINDSNIELVSDLAQKYFPDGVDTDQCLMEVVNYAIPTDDVVGAFLASMTNGESWDDIDYHSPARSAWVGRQHIKRILDISRCYSSASSKYYQDPEVLEALLSAIEFWCDGGFVCNNWWYNAIGVPKEFAPALLLLEDKISPELMAKCIEVLEPAELEKTGQNKVWLNGITFIKGLLLKDTSIIKRTSEAIKSELRLSHEEGIQYDYSFHQHGAMQQFGNYGLAFASSQSYWMRVLNGSSYDFTSEQKQIMRNYISKGVNVTIWKGYMDVSSCGRQLFISSQAGKSASLLISNINMLEVDKQGEQDYSNYILRNYINPSNNDLKGNFAYPISKYTVHRADDFMFSVKMFSTRIKGGEITNNENLKGYHLADGATMIYVNGQEYEDIFAVWDGKYMPGTTVEYNDKPLKRISNQDPYLNGSDFVGGISHGMYGLSALEYRRDAVSSNKTWFFIDDVVLCLGNGIEAQSGDPLVTTLNQCNYQDAAYHLADSEVKEIEMEQSYSSSRVFSDGVGYESLDSSAIEFFAREQVGDWHDVADFFPSKQERGNVFTAQIHHKPAEQGSYAYLVRPNADRDKFLNGEYENGFKVLQNSTTVTHVEVPEQKIAMLVFWTAGEVSSEIFGTIKASAPVMAVLSMSEDGQANIEVYAPTEDGYTCEDCGYSYDPADGDPELCIDPNTTFEEVSSDGTCPICKGGKKPAIIEIL